MWAHMYLRILHFTYLFFGVWNWSKAYCSLWTYSSKFNGLWFRLWVKPQLYTFLIIERTLIPFCLHVCWYRDLIFPMVNAGICHFLPEACSIFIQCSQTVYFSNRFVGMLMEVWHRLRMQLTQIISKTQWAVSIETEVLSFSFKLQICAPWVAGDVPRGEGWVTPTEVYQHPCSGKCSQSFEEKTLGDC